MFVSDSSVPPMTSDESGAYAVGVVSKVAMRTNRPTRPTEQTEKCKKDP